MYEVYDITAWRYVCRKETYREACEAREEYEKHHPYNDVIIYGVYD